MKKVNATDMTTDLFVMDYRTHGAVGARIIVLVGETSNIAIIW